MLAGQLRDSFPAGRAMWFYLTRELLHCPSPDTGTYSRDDQEHLPAAAMRGRGSVTWNERRQDERRLTEAHPLTKPSSPG
jgi:hypothetical protein